MSRWDVSFRSDGRVELLCEHGVGHPSAELTLLRGVAPRPWHGTHGCDNCCQLAEFDDVVVAALVTLTGKR